MSDKVSPRWGWSGSVFWWLSCWEFRTLCRCHCVPTNGRAQAGRPVVLLRVRNQRERCYVKGMTSCETQVATHRGILVYVCLCLFMCVYVFVYICMCGYLWICGFMSVCVCTCVCLWVSVCECVRMCAPVCACVCSGVFCVCFCVWVPPVPQIHVMCTETGATESGIRWPWATVLPRKEATDSHGILRRCKHTVTQLGKVYNYFITGWLRNYWTLTGPPLPPGYQQTSMRHNCPRLPRLV